MTILRTDKTLLRRLLLLFVWLVQAVSLSAQGSDVFEKYFSAAMNFAKSFPREKVFLHFDNTSYYQGDTIWYKAYVVTAEDNKLSRISKPLYVEFVDQLGNVMERQIVKLKDGEGSGQISLANAFFTGYYEVRAYTKWMLSFGSDPQYFSRTLPVYRKRLNNEDAMRSIATYRMDRSMKQRPKQNGDKLTVNFYPEGGNLVQGITSAVGFEVMSADSGRVNINGYLLSESGERQMMVSAIHDGMGVFAYTPTEKQAQVEFEFDGKKHRFKLPKALPSGYTAMVSAKETSFDVTLSRSKDLPTEPLALFVFAGNTPCTYVPVDFGTAQQKRIKILNDELPSGVLRLSLVNSAGNTLLDRFCFVYPKDTLSVEASADAAIYAPFKKAECTFKVTDSAGKPVPNAHLSVSIRDGLDMDYVRYDNTLLTDLLLTSELKGYIHRPGFYFIDRSTSRRRMLDNLLLIRGWRKYDLQESFGVKTCEPKYLPETSLNLYGHVDSWYGKAQSGIGITVMAQRDSTSFVGSTRADSLGNFVVPLDEFYGTMESLIQTRRDNKKYNRNALISIDRNFEPVLRALDYQETNPRWDIPTDTTRLSTDIEAFETTQKGDERVLELDEVVVKGKYKRRGLLQETERFERDIYGYYNIRQIVDRMRDEGKLIPNDVGNLLHTINDKIDRDGTLYGVNELKYSANGQEITAPFLNDCIDMMETAMLYADRTGLYAYKFNDDDFRVDVSELTDIYTGIQNMDTVNQAKLNKMFVRCAFRMVEGWRSGKNYTPTHGIRRTSIQGYNLPVEFYSPQYADNMMNDGLEDRRRTIYWNPEITTDENGIATVKCYNSHNTTYLNVSAMTLSDGQLGCVEFSTYPKTE